jgi:uncharacterized protein (DUF1501 family)
LPWRALASSGSERRFLFISCKGGWDQTWAFAPLFGRAWVDMPEDAEAAELAGIPFVDADTRPAMRNFLRDWGDRTAVLNGMEVASLTHEGCRRIVCTGETAEGHDDWATILAGHAVGDPLLPLVHVSGPSFAAAYGSSVVRVGANDQLVELLDATRLARSDLAVVPPSAIAEAAMDARVQAIAAERAENAGPGWARRLLEGATSAEARLTRLKQLGLADSLGGAGLLVDDVEAVLAHLSAGRARVAMVEYAAWDNVFNGWDTHTQIDLQGNHFTELFETLSTTMARAEALPGAAGGSLLDELTIVVFSEMGRYPLLNGDGGKDHWTWTSAMLLGSGVAGGRAVGGYDDLCRGRRLDLASGEATDAGVPLLAGNLGATLLTLGGVDPAEFVGDHGVIAAVLS